MPNSVIGSMTARTIRNPSGRVVGPVRLGPTGRLTLSRAAALLCQATGGPPRRHTLARGPSIGGEGSASAVEQARASGGHESSRSPFGTS